MYNNWAAINSLCTRLVDTGLKLLWTSVCVKQPLSPSDTFITVLTNYSSIRNVVRSLSLENIGPFGYAILI